MCMRKMLARNQEEKNFEEESNKWTNGERKNDSVPVEEKFSQSEFMEYLSKCLFSRVEVIEEMEIQKRGIKMEGNYR